MSDWLLALKIYMGLGLLVAAVVVISHLRMKRDQPSSLMDAIKSLNPSRQRFWYRVLEDVVVPMLTFILVWLVWPVAIVLTIIEMLKDKKAGVNRDQRNKSKAFFLSKDALLKEMTVAEIERTNMVIDPMDSTPNLPFGHLNALWVGFRDGLEPDETLHLFESVGPNTFKRQLIWGYAVCKAGRIDRFMTAGWRR